MFLFVFFRVGARSSVKIVMSHHANDFFKIKGSICFFSGKLFDLLCIVFSNRFKGVAG